MKVAEQQDIKTCTLYRLEPIITLSKLYVYYNYCNSFVQNCQGYHEHWKGIMLAWNWCILSLLWKKDSKSRA